MDTITHLAPPTLLNTLEELKLVPEFKAIPEDQFRWLAEKGVLRKFNDGDRIFAKGDEIAGMQIVFRGGVNLKYVQGGSQRDMGTYEPHEILGRLPYSRMKAATGEGFAVGETILFFVHKDLFPELVSHCYEITEVLVHNMTDRVRDFTKQQQQNDKMMSLGKLSAGLAHELNNPSAAIVRSAHELKRLLANVPDNFKAVIKIRVGDAEIDKLNSMVAEKIENCHMKPISLKEKTAIEDEVTNWLEGNNINDAYELVETFADFGISKTDLDMIKSWIRAEDVFPVLGWVNQVLNTEKLISDIEEASKRINVLVTSVKGYTHMDQAPERALVDIHLGIRNTLTMLNHKLKKNSIEFIENFQQDLPQAKIFVSEMNQVWTNIIDNAIDAMENRKNSTLEIQTQKEREFIIVRIIDNGPGIPKDIVDKIFDPFFTTKPVGKGTGLGLEVVQQIITQHNGKVTVKSEPGRTEFEICFPIGN
ncbi:ATP-binding protein [soil metagenome]